MAHKIVPVLLIFMISLTFGCSGNVPLKGKVTFEDGSPLTIGTVMFQGEKTTARGIIQSDGTFTVGSKKPGDGIPRGESYSICIIGADEPIPAGPVSIALPLIADKYRKAKTSGWTFLADGKTKFLELKAEKPDPDVTNKIKEQAKAMGPAKEVKSPFASPAQ